MKKEHKEEMKARARNIGLLIAYDGGNYHGFQRQLPPVTAVQNVLEEKLALVFGDTIELAAAGRTDRRLYGRIRAALHTRRKRQPQPRLRRRTRPCTPQPE